MWRGRLQLFAMFFCLTQECDILHAQTPPSIPDRLLHDTLATIDGEVITAGEFLYNYGKTLINDPAPYSYHSMRDYLALYINFRLKVRHARELRIDTIGRIRSEVDAYRRRLQDYFLQEKAVIAPAVEEAYQHMKKDIRVRAIVLQLSDTFPWEKALQVYSKINEQLKKGTTFAQLATIYSHDTATASKGGILGWFTALQLPYPVEKALWEGKLPVLAPPYRYREKVYIFYGDSSRTAPGQVLTAHIFLPLPKSASAQDIETVREQARSLYTRIRSGEDFAELARRYSQDAGTSLKGGEFRWFGTGETLPEYEEAAFALKDQQVSEPVFTSRGFYIVKRLQSKPLPPFNEVKDELRRKVLADRERIDTWREEFLKKVRTNYNFKENKRTAKLLTKSRIYTLLLDTIPTENQCSRLAKMQLFTLAGKTYTLADLCQHITDRWRSDVEPTASHLKRYYHDFVNTVTEKVAREHLAEIFPEYGRLLTEYQEGILLFEYMDSMVWSRALKDTVGLIEYFKQQQENQQYWWDERARAIVFTCSNQQACKEVERLVRLRWKWTPDTIVKTVNKTHGAQAVRYEEGVYERGQNSNVDRVLWKLGPSEIFSTNGKWILVYIKELKTPEPKQLEEVRGQVTADFQKYLEEELIGALRKKYTVRVNEDLLREIATAVGSRD